jgi:hypothetical protein
MPTQPFTTANDSPTNLSYSPYTSYLRDNIAFPANSGLLVPAASAVNERADTDIEDRLPSGATVASLPDANAGG